MHSAPDRAQIRQPARTIEDLFRELTARVERPGWKGSGITRLAMELADLPGHPARAAVSRHKAAVESWLAHSQTRRRQTAPTRRTNDVAHRGFHSLILIH
jgi:hypothetical protein